MRYLKTYESYKINEEVPGSIGAIVGGSHKSKEATQEKATDKPDEFLCNALVNVIMKKWGTYNCTIKECKIVKAEPKKGFFNKLFAENSTIEFHLVSDRLKVPIQMKFKLKKDKFVRVTESNGEKLITGYVVEEQADKFIKYVLTQSKYKDELKQNFENIEETFTKESFDL
jgi:hypothetical protein